MICEAADCGSEATRKTEDGIFLCMDCFECLGHEIDDDSE